MWGGSDIEKLILKWPLSDFSVNENCSKLKPQFELRQIILSTEKSFLGHFEWNSRFPQHIAPMSPILHVFESNVYFVVLMCCLFNLGKCVLLFLLKSSSREKEVHMKSAWINWRKFLTDLLSFLKANWITVGEISAVFGVLSQVLRKSTCSDCSFLWPYKNAVVFGHRYLNYRRDLDCRISEWFQGRRKTPWPAPISHLRGLLAVVRQEQEPRRLGQPGEEGHRDEKRQRRTHGQPAPAEARHDEQGTSRHREAAERPESCAEDHRRGSSFAREELREKASGGSGDPGHPEAWRGSESHFILLSVLLLLFFYYYCDCFRRPENLAFGESQVTGNWQQCHVSLIQQLISHLEMVEVEHLRFCSTIRVAYSQVLCTDKKN